MNALNAQQGHWTDKVLKFRLENYTVSSGLKYSTKWVDTYKTPIKPFKAFIRTYSPDPWETFNIYSNSCHTLCVPSQFIILLKTVHKHIQTFSQKKKKKKEWDISSNVTQSHLVRFRYSDINNEKMTEYDPFAHFNHTVVEPEFKILATQWPGPIITGLRCSVNVDEVNFTVLKNIARRTWRHWILDDTMIVPSRPPHRTGGGSVLVSGAVLG